MKKEIAKITKKREISGVVVSNKMTGTVRVQNRGNIQSQRIL
jgi:ribosomal protein S17